MLFLIIVLFFVSIRIEFQYCHKRDKNQGSITFFVFGDIIRYQIKIPALSMDVSRQELWFKSLTKTKEEEKKITKEEVKKYMELSQQMVRRIEHFYQIISRFFKQVTFEKLQWETSIGTGDAAETGILTGVLWGAKTALIATAGKIFRWQKRPMIEIRPHFTDFVFETKFHSIIRFRIGHAILAINRILLQLISTRRGMK